MDKKGSTRKFCLCPHCNGKWISTSGFYEHQNKFVKHAIESTSPLSKFKYDDSFLKDERLQRPLYDGAKTCVLDAILKHMYVFAMNHGLSKSAVSDILACEKSSLPQPNYLPCTFQEAKGLIKPLLIPLEKFDACVNDCILYRNTATGQYKSLSTCPICQEPRHINGKSQKTFTYMPVGPRLARWFGTSSLCKLLYSNKISFKDRISDFTEGKMYQKWFMPGEVFAEMDEALTVPLSLFTDGVNPNKHMTNPKSMWPIILTWINLPRTVRQLLGPMMIVGIIPSGKNGSEPKSLEPYLELLIDELLTLTEFNCYSDYHSAPVTIKAALLQYLCDIPAYSKLFQLNGHCAIRSCPHCREVGVRCQHLKKTIHLSNRRFLGENDILRNTSGFGIQEPERRVAPHPYTPSQELKLRQKYDSSEKRSKKSKIQKFTGVKGTYALMRLPYHCRLDQMQPDGMHTIADFIGHIIDVIVGKHDTPKVKMSEQSMNRFENVWHNDTDEEPSNPKKQKTELAASQSAFKYPWSLTKEQVKEADQRARNICYTDGEEVSPDVHFSKPWTLRTMNSKLQFVTSGALQWCIRGFLHPTQEKTLFFLINVIKKLITPSLHRADIEEIQSNMHKALCFLERDFPLTLQNLTTHLIHHLVDGLEDFGPLYGRWLFPYERANGWITRQCLRKNEEEATIMETYAIYDWCAHMVLSNKFSPSEIFAKGNKYMALAENLQTGIGQEILPSEKCGLKKSKLTKDMRHHMFHFYVNELKLNVLNFDDEVKEEHRCLTSEDCYGRHIKYIGHEFKRKAASLVKIPSKSGLQFGAVEYFLIHKVNNTSHTWIITTVYPLSEQEKEFCKFEPVAVSQRLYHISVLSKPLVNVKMDGNVWILNCD